MKVNIWFLGLMVIILILWYIAIPITEKFESQINMSAPTPPFKDIEGIKPRIHAKIDKNGDAAYYSWQSPHMNGEQGCTQVPCPSKFDDNIICWCCCNYF